MSVLIAIMVDTRRPGSGKIVPGNWLEWLNYDVKRALCRVRSNPGADKANVASELALVTP